MADDVDTASNAKPAMIPAVLGTGIDSSLLFMFYF